MNIYDPGNSIHSWTMCGIMIKFPFLGDTAVFEVDSCFFFYLFEPLSPVHSQLSPQKSKSLIPSKALSFKHSITFIFVLIGWESYLHIFVFVMV